MNALLLVGLGGAVGAMLRYGVGLLALRLAPGYPWGTLAVNVAGGLAMGALVAAAPDRRLLLLLGTGVLGGFTTFSAFSIEAVQMLQRGAAGAALTYAGLSVALSVGAAYVGVLLVKGWS